MIQVPLKPATLYHQKTILVLLGLERCFHREKWSQIAWSDGARDNVLIFCVKSSHPQTIRRLTILLSILQGFPKEMITMWGKGGRKKHQSQFTGPTMRSSTERPKGIWCIGSIAYLRHPNIKKKFKTFPTTRVLRGSHTIYLRKERLHCDVWNN